MTNKTKTQDIRDKCLELFSSKNIFLNVDETLLSDLRTIFNIKSVTTLLKDEELVKTAKLFLENNLNISTASKVGFMHRNTLIYRLEKINKLVGLDIKNFKDAVVFENIILFNDIINK